MVTQYVQCTRPVHCNRLVQYKYNPRKTSFQNVFFWMSYGQVLGAIVVRDIYYCLKWNKQLLI